MINTNGETELDKSAGIVTCLGDKTAFSCCPGCNCQHPRLLMSHNILLAFSYSVF